MVLDHRPRQTALREKRQRGKDNAMQYEAFATSLRRVQFFACMAGDIPNH